MLLEIRNVIVLLRSHDHHIARSNSSCAISLCLTDGPTNQRFSLHGWLILGDASLILGKDSQASLHCGLGIGAVKNQIQSVVTGIIYIQLRPAG
jgi:hypothetical protein